MRPRTLVSLRRLARAAARAVARSPLSIVFDERYQTALPGVPMDPGRGAQVLAFLLDRGLVRRRDVHHPIPPSLRHVLRTHDERYLDSLQDPAVLSAIIGTPVHDDQVRAILDLQRLVAGGTIQATRLALARRRPAVHLGGGLHHAGPDRGMGFCAFNDIAIAIRRLRAKGYRRPMLVVDLDLHHGNGTRAVFASDPTVHTLSIHNQDWDDVPAVASTDIALGSGVTDAAYLDVLRSALPPLLAGHRPGLVVYVAGADPAADDTMGDWRISAAAMLERDRFVVEQTRTLAPRAALVVVLGGGYGHGAWRYTARFLSWLASGRALDPPDDMELTLRRFRGEVRRTDRALAAVRARESDEWRISVEDLFGPEPGVPRETRILGRYTPQGFELLLERVGVLHHLRTLGYPSPVLDVDFGSGLGQTVRVFGEPERRHLLIEVRLRRDRRLVPGADVVFVEWLLLQNPRARFSERLPPLPGQQHPGLGLLGVIVGLLVLIAEQAGIDGVVNVPSHYFVAAVGRKHLRFLDPVAQARFDTLSSLFAGLPLAEAERLLDGRVVDEASGRIVRWEPAPMVIPVSARLRQQVDGEAYRAARDAARSRLRYRVLGRDTGGGREDVTAGA